MQLRKSDVVCHDGIHCIHITPTAGSVKSRSYRVVPLHPQLIELGFLEMVNTLPDGPLFYPLDANNSENSAAKNAGDKVRVWARELVGSTGGRIQPNHAWRHRFKTICREAGIHRELCDAITGHEDGTASTQYGEYTPRALSQAVNQLPAYRV